MEVMRVNMTFREDADKELFHQLKALPNWRSKAVFLHKLIFLGLDVYKKKGMEMPRKRMSEQASPSERGGKIEKKVEPVRTGVVESKIDNPFQSIENIDTPNIGDDDFTMAFVSGLLGVPKR